MTSKRKTRSDNKVKELYRLENCELPRGAEFTSKEQIQAFVDEVTSDVNWIGAAINVPRKVKVFDYGDSLESVAEKNEIWLARKHWCAQVVLHELAHICGHHHHGVEFTRAYLWLIRNFMGVAYEERYKAAFKRVGIEV